MGLLGDFILNSIELIDFEVDMDGFVDFELDYTENVDFEINDGEKIDFVLDYTENIDFELDLTTAIDNTYIVFEKTPSAFDNIVIGKDYLLNENNDPILTEDGVRLLF